ncbi:MAG: hypothetical protein LQ342_000751 [Letrouitia transgressa]|nr:MAG: hypothetical protein LQ342_000751 [Letrouitia transgressa]
MSDLPLQSEHFPQISYEVDEPLNQAPSKENVECDCGKAFILGDHGFCSLAFSGMSSAAASEAIESLNVHNVRESGASVGISTPGHLIRRNARALLPSGRDKDLFSNPELRIPISRPPKDSE